tara:strand:- start:46 stop:234 length:189 start_codon:yes stop_codon:yes gene_type:complete
MFALIAVEPPYFPRSVKQEEQNYDRDEESQYHKGAEGGLIGSDWGEDIQTPYSQDRKIASKA